MNAHLLIEQGPYTLRFMQVLELLSTGSKCRGLGFLCEVLAASPNTLIIGKHVVIPFPVERVNEHNQIEAWELGLSYLDLFLSACSAVGGEMPKLPMDMVLTPQQVQALSTRLLGLVLVLVVRDGRPGEPNLVYEVRGGRYKPAIVRG